jgi:hypothetical protein
MKARTAAILVSIALAVGSTSTAIILAGNGAAEACHNQQALVDGLYKIMNRSTERLPQFVAEGTITQAQADQAMRDNAESKRDIKRPQC